MPSKWNTADHASYVLNASVYLPEVAAILGRPAAKKIPREYNAELRRRFSAEPPGEPEAWWQVARSTDSQAVAQQIKGVVETQALPWLERVTDYPALAEALADPEC
mgnify:FL=1